MGIKHLAWMAVQFWWAAIYAESAAIHDKKPASFAEIRAETWVSAGGKERMSWVSFAQQWYKTHVRIWPHQETKYKRRTEEDKELSLRDIGGETTLSRCPSTAHKRINFPGKNQTIAMLCHKFQDSWGWTRKFFSSLCQLLLRVRERWENNDEFV